MSRLTCLALMVAAFLWTGDLACRSIAIAQDAPGISEGQRAAGEALLASGKAAYRAGNYTEALRSFQQALARLGRPAIYADIGDAAGRLGDHQRAVDAYREYLGAIANAPDRAQVEEKIRAHEKALREAEGGNAETLDLSPAAAASTTGEAAAPGAPADTNAPAAKRSGGGELWWLWAGIGAAVVGTVIAALIVTSSDDPVQPPMRGSVGGTIQTLEVR